MESFIPLSVPNLKGNELKYVTDAIEQEWVSTGGAYIKKFEESIASYVQKEDAVALQSGTAGLHLSLKMAGVKPEDEVIVPTLTFIAAVNPVRYLGAEPIFMDCDDNLCMDINKLEKFCENECSINEGQLIHIKTQKRISALIIVHVFGNMPDMERLMKIARKYHLQVIEDATEALGSYIKSGMYKGKFAGTIGDFGVYSFNGNKIITTGGGGAVVSNHPERLAKLRYLSTQAKDDELYYIHENVGYNYRMTNLQAAIGIAQMEKLDDFIKIKRNNYNQYQLGIKTIKGLSLMQFSENIRSNCWFYSLKIEKEFPLNRDELLVYFQKNQIQTRPIWGLIHQQRPYIYSENYQIEKAPMYYDKILNLPCSTNIKEVEVSYIIDLLRRIADEKTN